MVSITVVLAAVLVLPIDFQTGTIGTGTCGGSYPPPKNSTIVFRSGTSGNDSVLTVVHINGAGGKDIYLDNATVQIICGNSHNVVVQFPKSGTGIGGGDVKHFEFYNLENDGTYDPGDYFIVHICDNVHNGDIFRVLDGNVTAGEVRML
jgi:hypothetical protein